MQNKVIYHTPRFSVEEKIDNAIRFTEVYKANSNAHKSIREAMCMDAQFPESLCGIMENDLFVGRFDPVVLASVSPQVGGKETGLGYCFRAKTSLEILENEDLDDEYSKKLLGLMDFWKVNDTREKCHAAYTPEMNRYFKYRHYTDGPGIGFPLYRIAGIYIDYNKLLRLGVKGLTEQAEQYKKNAADKGHDPDLYEGVILALRVVTKAARWYADEARALIPSASPERKAELEGMAGALEKISWYPPESFYEALMFAYLYSVVIATREYGRMDEYMGDFYAKDLAAGKITEEGAIRMLESLWRMIVARNETFDDRIIVGGVGRKTPENADKFALIAMEASRRVKDVVPHLTLRCYKGMNPALYQTAISVIAEGCTYPILYNDDVNVPAVQNAFNTTYDAAADYVPLGCGEYILNHRHISSPNGTYNLLNGLYATMHDGLDPFEGFRMGLKQGDFVDFETFDDLWAAYCKNIDTLNDVLAETCALIYKVVGGDVVFPLVMPLYDGVMDTGKGLIDGGAINYDASIESYGLINTADSFTALKRLVYDQKLITKQEMITALDANFEGYEKVRAMCLACPKYGNDNKDADNMAIKVHEHFCLSTIRAGKKAGLNAFLVVNINNKSNTTWGRLSWASPDGRLKGMPMANANNPQPGMDKNGVTAFLHSLTKLRPDIHAGYVQNMKFSKELFNDMRPIAEAALETYWDNGGTQAMITVIGREDLQAAMLHPENYPNLIVRVGGFSARFVELEKDVQMEILSRTCY